MPDAPPRTPAEGREVYLRPGWLLRDVERASQRVAEWTRAQWERDMKSLDAEYSRRRAALLEIANTAAGDAGARGGSDG